MEKELKMVFEKTLDSLSKEALLILKLVTISSQPYKHFKWDKTNSSQVDFEKFYEEIESKDLLILLKELHEIWAS